MLIKLIFNTLPKSYRKVEELMFDECSQLKSRSKRRKKKELIFKTNALVPKTTVIRKEEGATVASSPTFPQYSGPLRLSFCGPDGQRSP